MLFLSLLRQRLLGRCYAAKPSLDLIGWLILFLVLMITSPTREARVPPKSWLMLNVHARRLHVARSEVWLAAEQYTVSDVSVSAGAIYRHMWQMANSNKKTLSKNLAQMKVRPNTSIIFIQQNRYSK